jgi:hypothetical protein
VGVERCGTGIGGGSRWEWSEGGWSEVVDNGRIHM